MKKTLFLSLFLCFLFSPNTYAQDVPVTILEGHTNSVSSVSFSPDGQTLVSGSWDKTVRVWDVNTGRHLRTLTGHTNRVTYVSFSPDGQTLVSGSWDGTVRVWDVNTGRHLRTLTVSGVISISFSPDGQTLASGSLDGTVRLWDVNTGRHLHTLAGHTHNVTYVSFSPNGNTLASGGGWEDGTVRLWDVNTGRHLRTLTGHTDSIRSISFSPDGQTLVSGSWDETVRLWDVKTGRPLRTLTEHTDSVASIKFIPNDKMLTSNGSSRVAFWEVSTGTLIGTRHISLDTNAAEIETNAAESVAFSPDGQTLAMGYLFPGIICIWDLPLTRVSITALPVDAPAIGKKLTLNIGITEGENVNGYQAAVKFDDTALRYVESANGDYLPANAFFVPPVVGENVVMLGATAVALEKSGGGTLATVTFEFIAIKESTLTLFQTIIVNSDGEHLPFFFGNRKNYCWGPTPQGGRKP